MKTFVLLLLLAPMAVFAQHIDKQLLLGTWILSDIQSNDSITVSKNDNDQVAATSDGKTATEKTEVAVKDQMSKSLQIGVAKFIFEKSSYQFFRKEKLSQSGTYQISEDRLTLTFNGKEQPNQKTSKIISVSATQLVLETEFDNKPVKILFEKKQ